MCNVTGADGLAGTSAGFVAGALPVVEPVFGAVQPLNARAATARAEARHVNLLLLPSIDVPSFFVPDVDAWKLGIKGGLHRLGTRDSRRRSLNRGHSCGLSHDQLDWHLADRLEI